MHPRYIFLLIVNLIALIACLPVVRSVPSSSAPIQEVRHLILTPQLHFDRTMDLISHLDRDQKRLIVEDVRKALTAKFPLTYGAETINMQGLMAAEALGEEAEPLADDIVAMIRGSLQPGSKADALGRIASNFKDPRARATCIEFLCETIAKNWAFGRFAWEKLRNLSMTEEEILREVAKYGDANSENVKLSEQQGNIMLKTRRPSFTPYAVPSLAWVFLVLSKGLLLLAVILSYLVLASLLKLSLNTSFLGSCALSLVGLLIGFLIFGCLLTLVFAGGHHEPTTERYFFFAAVVSALVTPIILRLFVRQPIPLLVLAVFPTAVALWYAAGWALSGINLSPIL